MLKAVALLLQLNADIYESDPELEKIRTEQGYSYMDIITIHKDTLPNYEEKVTRVLCCETSIPPNTGSFSESLPLH